MTTHFLLPSVVADSRTCCRITNRNTGLSFERVLGPDSAWELLYNDCLKKQDIFLLEYDGDTAAEHKNVPRYSEAELKDKSFPALKIIAEQYGITGRDKLTLIEGILKAQDKAVTDND